MFFKKAIRNIRRHKLKSVLAVVTCMLIVVFLFLYISGIVVNQRELDALPAAIPINARISNLNGSLNMHMKIKDSVISGIEDSKYVADYDYTEEVGAALTKIPEEEAEDVDQGSLDFPFCLGVNREEAYPDLMPNAISYVDGYDRDVLEGDEPVCLMGENELKERNLKAGDSVWMTVFYFSYPNDNAYKVYKWMGIYEVKIVGSFKNDFVEDANRTEQVLFPVKWLQKLHAQTDVPFFADSARFRVADPLRLNNFKAEMKKLGLLSVISEANYSQRGFALTVYDETFIKTATRLNENISLMKMLMPLVVGIVGLLGFVVSYLLLQSRRPEFAIMRSLGVSQKSCFFILFLENAVLELAGSLAGVFIASFFIEINASFVCAVVLPFFVCYMTGTSVALILLGRFSVMQVLTALD